MNERAKCLNLGLPKRLLALAFTEFIFQRLVLNNRLNFKQGVKYEVI